MKKYFLLLLFLFVLLASQKTEAQYIISGQAIDSLTSEPVSFVSVSTQKDLSSYVANGNGEFKISSDDKYDSLFFSSMGYKSCSFSIKDLQNQASPVVIKMAPANNLMQDIAVYPPKAIVQRAIENVPNNYYHDLFSITGLYRERIKSGNEYVGFAESTFSYLDWGYNKEIYNTRLSDWNVNPFMFEQSRRSNYSISTSKFGMDRWFLHFENLYFEKKYIRDGFFSGDEIDSHEYTYEGESYYNGQKVTIISFKPNSKMINKFTKKPKLNHLLALGKIFITDKDYAIVKFSVTMYNDWYLNYKKKFSEGEYSKVVYFMAEVNYTKLEDKYFVDYSRLECKYADVMQKKQVHEISEIFIDHRDLQPMDSDKYKRYTNIFNWNYFVAEPYRWTMNKYNPQFWKNYVGVPIDDYEMIGKDLELSEPLETQFRNNSEKELSNNK